MTATRRRGLGCAGGRAQVLAEVNIGFGARQLSAEAHLIDMVPACPLISLWVLAVRK